MVIVGHMSSKSTFGAKNTGQKFLTPKNFWWCRNVCPDSCPGVIFGAGRGSALFFRGGAGRGGAELKIFGAGAARGSHFPRGRGGAGRGVHPCRLESPMTVNLKMELNTAGFVRGQTPAKDFKIA